MSVFKKKGAPSVTPADEQYMEQIKTYGDSLPELLKYQQMFEPQFLEQNIEMQEKFSPRLAQLQREVSQQVNPLQATAEQKLMKLLSTRGDLSSLNISPELTKSLQQDIRSGQAARGLLRSPVSALTEAQASLGQRVNERDKFINLASALQSQLPVGQAPSIATSTFGDIQKPNISAMTSLQQQANELAFKRWEIQRKESERRRQAVFGAGKAAAGVGMMFVPGGQVAGAQMIGSGMGDLQKGGL